MELLNFGRKPPKIVAVSDCEKSKVRRVKEKNFTTTEVSKLKLMVHACLLTLAGKKNNLHLK